MIYIKNSFKINKISISKIISIIMSIGIIIKEFYIFKSGYLQIGDLFLVTPFIITTLIHKKIFVHKIDIYIILFVLFAVLINAFYYLLYKDTRLLLSSSYLIYALIIINITRTYMKDQFFLKSLVFSAKVVIILQMLIFLFGKGRYYSYRYMGTFNDPNQFGYFIVTMILIIYTINNILNHKTNLLRLLTSIFLIYKSQSTSMFLGILIFCTLSIFNNIDASKIKYNKITYLTFILLLVIIFIYKNRLLNMCNVRSYNRMIDKINNISSLKDAFYKFLNDRAIIYPLKNPMGFIYGTGEGGFFRNLDTELHSTIIAFAYYYGILPFSLFVIWLKNNLSKSDKKLMGVYVSLIFIAFTIINHRQPTFWMILVLCSNNKIRIEENSVKRGKF